MSQLESLEEIAEQARVGSNYKSPNAVGRLARGWAISSAIERAHVARPAKLKQQIVAPSHLPTVPEPVSSPLAELRKPGAYARLHGTGRALRDGLAALVAKSGLPAQVIGETTVFDLVFSDRPLTDYRAMLTADAAMLKTFNAECLSHGVVKGHQKLYVSLAHTDEDVAKTLEVFEAALGVCKRSRK